MTSEAFRLLVEHPSPKKEGEYRPVPQIFKSREEATKYAQKFFHGRRYKVEPA